MKHMNKGFTIIELLIALSIFIIVSIMTAVIFRSTQQSFTNARAFQHVLDLARQTVVRMHSEIKATFIAESQLISFLGIDAAGSHLKAASQEDELFFIWPDKGASTGDICEVGYWQRNDGHLMRHYENPPDFDFSTTLRDDELGLVIKGLNFSYYDGDAFQDTWDCRPGGAQEGVFPTAVKFSFVVSDESSIVQKTFESLVRIASSGR